MDHSNVYPARTVLAQQYELRAAVTVASGNVTAQAPSAAQSLFTPVVSTSLLTCTFDKVPNAPVYADLKIVKASGTWDGKADVVAVSTTSVTFQCRKSSDGTALAIPDGTHLVSIVLDNSVAVS